MEAVLRVIKEATRPEMIYDRLANIVGSRYVSDRAAERLLYRAGSLGCTEILQPGICHFAVMPKSVEEVQAIVRFANAEKIPITPWCGGTSGLASAHPWEGGIVMDMKRMNKILEVDEDSMYAVIEAGVTFGDLKGYMEKYHPDYYTPGCHGPPSAGAGVVFLGGGMLDNSFISGSAESITGLEVVLPTGEIIRTGSHTFSKYWCGRPPLWDLTGLFIGAGGTTGIITKFGVKIWPKNLRADYIACAPTFKGGFEKIVYPLVRADLGIRWFYYFNNALAMATLPLDQVPLYPEKIGVDNYYQLTTLTAYSEKEMEAKEESLKSICKKGGAKYVMNIEQTVETLPLEKRSDITHTNFPRGTTLFPRIIMQSTGNWIPTQNTVPYVEECTKYAAEKWKFPAHMYGRFLDHGHYNVCRACTLGLDRDKPGDAEIIMDMAKKFTEIGIKYGGVRYKPQHWATRMLVAQADPSAIEFARRLKKFLDPQRIMNPGHEW